MTQHTVDQCAVHRHKRQLMSKPCACRQCGPNIVARHLSGKGGVALLPEELPAADEGYGVLELPAHHICPLITFTWQVPMAADPLHSNVDQNPSG